MIKKILTLAFIVMLVYACKKDNVNTNESARDNDGFTIYETHFLDALWKVDPDWATMVGYHKYDSLMVIPNSSSRNAKMDFTKYQMDSLSRFNPDQLNDANRMDFHMMQDRMDAIQWEIQQEKAYEWNPGTYNQLQIFAHILNENYAPLAKRLRNFYQRMSFIPAYYKQAEKEIKNPVQELTDLTVEQLTGGISVIEKDFADSLKKSNIPAPEQKQMLDRAQTSAKTITDFANWLKTLKNDKARSFRLGKDLFEAKFKFNIQSVGSAQQLYNSAVERKKNLHREMTKLTVKLWPKYFGKAPMPKDSLVMIRQMIDTLSTKHVKPDEFQSAISKEIPELTSFIRSKNLLTLDDSKPLVIRKEPAYMAGVAGASISAPGPYDKNGNTYFNVGSLSGWTPEKAESYLREYNQYILQILCIHEAIPGHYTQLVYANKAPSMIKSIFENGAMVEGWAVYTEQMMLDAGFGNDEPEMRLMWYKWHLRSVCNAILDHDVHSGGMVKEDAIKFLTNEAFQQQAEAEGKWRRVSVTSVQLSSYYSGYKDIMDLREAYKTKMGDKYTLKDFNEKFLSYGSAPVKYIKEAMLVKQPVVTK